VVLNAADQLTFAHILLISEDSLRKLSVVRLINVTRVLNINRLFQKEDYMKLHQAVLFHRAREDVPHVFTAWSLMYLDCCVQTALRHYTRNHRSDIGTSEHVRM
jgi:hypothetical protein